MQERDDMQLFTYKYNGYIFQFRFLESNIKTYDEGKHFYFEVPVCEKDNKRERFSVSFRVEADDIDNAYLKTIEGIKKELEK